MKLLFQREETDNKKPTKKPDSVKEVNRVREERVSAEAPPGGIIWVRIHPCERAGRQLQAERRECGAGKGFFWDQEGARWPEQGGRAGRGHEKALTESHRKPLRGFNQKRDLI